VLDGLDQVVNNPIPFAMQRLILRLRCRVRHKPPVTVAIDNAANGDLGGW
jgi:hypothetical protein